MNDQLRILAVDDTLPILRFLVSTLSAEGCDVQTASSAEQALELLKGGPYDLVVSDIRMPGLSGLDLLRAVKGTQPDTPVVLITGVPSVDSAVFGLRHGAYDYLSKPFTARDVRELVRRLREDREHGQLIPVLPVGAAEVQARRRRGVEVLFRIGELALDGAESANLLERVLAMTSESLGASVALALVRNDQGDFSASHAGETMLVKPLLQLLHGSFDTVAANHGKDALELTRSGDPVAVLAALIPGDERPLGVLCVARETCKGAFLPDEKALLLGYSRNTALALQRLKLRDNIEKTLLSTIVSYVTAIESKEPYLKGHSARVSLYAGELARALELPDDEATTVCRAALLHDLGKLVIPDAILTKAGPLTPEEYEIVKSHTVVGDRILSPLGFLDREAKAVRHHHERFDGKGYPDGVRAGDIPKFVRIVTVADAFDAMTSTRPYRHALTVATALQQIARCAGSQFDPDIARVMLAVPRTRLTEISQFGDVPAGHAPEPAVPVGG